MFTFPRVIAQAAAVLSASLLLPALASASQFYVTASGAGAQTGSSWANAAPQTSLQTLLDGLQAGDTLNVGSGTYTVASLSISGDGTAAAPKQLVGANTGGGYPVFQGTFNIATASGGTFLSLPTTANYWNIRNLVIRNHRFPISLTQSGTTYTRYTHLLFENIATDSLEDGLRLYNCSDITVRNVSAIRYTKKAYRISDYSHDVLFERCYADCTGGDPDFPARSIPNGFFCDDTGGQAIIYNITFVDCTARNNGYYSASSTSYWNGDGFSSETGAHHLTFIRCQSFDNWDAGYDNKAANVTFQDCVAAGCLRGFRHWGNTATFDNCLAVNLVKRGGTGGTNCFWIDDKAVSLAYQNCTAASLTSNSTLAYVETDTVNGPLVFNDSVFYTGSATASFTNSNNITLASSTVTYRPGTGVDPAFVAANSAWRGTPVNAWDSQTYGTAKGYNSTLVNFTANTAPTVTVSASTTSGNAPLAVNFTASAVDADGIIVGYAWDFGDGSTSFAQNPSFSYSQPGTYVATCTVTDNRGAQTTASITIHATAPSVPVPIRIEAGATSAYTDAAGNTWAADFGYDAGSGLVDRGAIAIANTADDRIYQTERYDISDYSVILANGLYAVNLLFAETYSGTTAAGQRVFTVSAEGSIPSGWQNIDIFAQAGGKNIALVKSATVQVTDNFLDLHFAASVGGTLVNGIEILPVNNGNLPPTAPTGLVASAITNTGFTLSWTASTDDVGVAGYQVFVEGVAVASTTGGTTAVVSGLSSGTQYAVTVRAIDTAGSQSAPSATLLVTTAGAADTTPPSTPTGLAASAIATTSFSLSWTASTDNVAVARYDIFLNGIFAASSTSP